MQKYNIYDIVIHSIHINIRSIPRPLSLSTQCPIYLANVIGGPACFSVLHSSPVYKWRGQRAYRLQCSVYFCVLSSCLWEQKIPLHTCIWLWKGWVAKCLPYLGQYIQMRCLSRMKIMSCIHVFFSACDHCSDVTAISSAGVSPSSSNDSGLSNLKGFWIHLLSLKMSYLCWIIAIKVIDECN